MNELSNIIREHLLSSKVRIAKKLRTMDPEELAYKGLVILEESLGKTKPEGTWSCVKPLTKFCCSLGTLLLWGNDQEDADERTLRVNRFKAGHLILEAFDVAGLVDITKARADKKTRNAYKIQVKKDAEDTMEDLLSMVDTREVNIPIYTRPQFIEPLPFIKFYNPEAGRLVRNTNKLANEHFTMKNCPKVFEVINKHMSIAYNINQEVLEVYKASQEDPIFTFENKLDLDETQLSGLERERDKVLELAEMVGEREFWEYMFYDNRGRLYSSAVYLTHAGSKLSKSCLLYTSPSPRDS